MELAQYLTTWTAVDNGDGTFGWRSTVSLKHPWNPATGTGIARSTILTLPLPAQMPPDPSNSVFEIVADSATHDALETDTELTELIGSRALVGEENPLRNVVPTQPEYVQWRTRVLDQLNPLTGRPTWTTGQFNQGVGPTVAGRTWGEIEADTSEWLRGRPSSTPADTYTVSAVSLGGGKVGFMGADGSIDPTSHRDLDFLEVSERNGTIRLAFVETIPPIAQDVIYAISLGGESLLTADASFSVAEWVWTGTAINLSPNVDYPMTVSDAEVEIDGEVHINITARDLAAGFVGVNLLDSKFWGGFGIEELASNPAGGGTFIFNLLFGGIPVQQDIFHSIQVNGWTVYSADAAFDSTSQTWSWNNTNIQLNPGQAYDIVVRLDP